jgi:hypothetical protein
LLEPFHKLFPDVARRETHSVRLEDDGEPGGVPAGEYFFVESYCTNPDCECERVTIAIGERQLGIVASISYDFDESKLKSYDNLGNSCLDPSIRQSKYAEKALAIFKGVVLDKDYSERLKRHYRMVKSSVGPPRFSSARQADGMRSRSGELARQKRKQQKASRRKNQTR